MTIEGLDELKDLMRRWRLANGQIERLEGQIIDEEQRNAVLSGPVLWDNDAQAIFEQNNPKVVQAIRVLTQDLHRTLKG